MKKIITVILLIALISNTYSNINDEQIEFEKQVLTFGWDNLCPDIKQTDIPTIFIPGILASWYSEEWFEESKIKRWIPDPITHVYDTLFYTFKKNWYRIKDVFYSDEFNTYIDDIEKITDKQIEEWEIKWLFYLFWYDWKKDNKITAKMLSDLIKQIRLKYEQAYKCDIWTVNIVAHSMWGLVARAMLEDICASDEAIETYYDNIIPWKIKEIKSSSCENFTRVNKLITIGTPHRGSPGSFPLWEKGDIDRSTTADQAFWLRTQLWERLDTSIYKAMHWYSDKIPNWIVTVWQLLPDIWKSWIYNDSLRYLYQDNKILDRKNHPKNSFLEELNSSEKIDTMFSNISWKFTLYYSNLTWKTSYLWNNDYVSDIVWFKIPAKRIVWGDYINTYEDNTSSYKWKNIYELYNKDFSRKIYNITENIIDENWLWWDWTVPSMNSKFVPNDLYNPWLFENEKFQYKEVQCFYDEKWIPLKDREKEVSYKLWNTIWEMCSHTKLPITSSLDVYADIVSDDFKSDTKKSILEFSLWKIKELYSNIWYLDYIISFNTKIGDIIKNHYKNSFIDNELDIFLSNRDISENRYELFLWNSIKWILKYDILSPINIVIEDEQWRKIWIDPDTWNIINEIPWARTSWNTEWSWEPEYFLIPYTWTWKVNHKIKSYPTWNWEYHIVIQDLQKNNEWVFEQVNKNIIPWEAKLWLIENYNIDYGNWNINYNKIDKSLDMKYNDILEKIYNIIDNKYSEKQKEKLRNNLEKIISRWNEKNKYTYKVFYLIWKIFNYLNKSYE